MNWDKKKADTSNERNTKTRRWDLLANKGNSENFTLSLPRDHQLMTFSEVEKISLLKN